MDEIAGLSLNSMDKFNLIKIMYFYTRQKDTKLIILLLILIAYFLEKCGYTYYQIEQHFIKN